MKRSERSDAEIQLSKQVVQTFPNGDFARATQFQTLALEKMAADEDLSKDRRAAARKRMSARLGKYRNDRDYVLDYRAIDEMRAGRL